MSSNWDGGWPDDVNGDSRNGEPAIYFPPDRDRFYPTDEDSFPWTTFFWGIIIGLAGSVLVPVSAWVSGVLIIIGYGLTVFALADSKRAFARSLTVGFTLAAVSGAGLIATYIYAPEATWHFIEKAGSRHLLFPTFALMPWALGVLAYILALIAWPWRRGGVPASPDTRQG